MPAIAHKRMPQDNRQMGFVRTNMRGKTNDLDSSKCQLQFKEPIIGAF